MLQEERVLRKVDVGDYPLDLVPLERDVLSLELEGLFRRVRTNSAVSCRIVPGGGAGIVRRHTMHGGRCFLFLFLFFVMVSRYAYMFWDGFCILPTAGRESWARCSMFFLADWLPRKAESTEVVVGARRRRSSLAVGLPSLI